MMQRTICRFIRGSCRKFRENDCPSLGSEEVRQKNKSKEDFTPPRHTISEALGWTTGLVLTYELTHRQRRHCFGDSSSGTRDRIMLYLRNCPFAIAKAVSAQPALTPISTVRSVRSPLPKSSASLITRKSIDTTPFLKESTKFFPKDATYPKRASFDDAESDDEDVVHFDPTLSKFDEVRLNKPRDSQVSVSGEQVASDLFSAFGAFKMLSLFKGSTAPAPNDKATAEAFDILEKGAELGSNRALYNMGVAYDRMNETTLAMEYYGKAANLGHPLACYNVAVENLAQGNLEEGLNLMKYAAEKGVYEAAEVMKQY